jgi:hypothetical protein
LLSLFLPAPNGIVTNSFTSRNSQLGPIISTLHYYTLYVYTTRGEMGFPEET